jgi:hypothetical protein
MNITPRLQKRIEKAETLLAAFRHKPRPWGWPERVWRAYWFARMCSILNDIIKELAHIKRMSSAATANQSLAAQEKK